jgi:hypothetical protein
MSSQKDLESLAKRFGPAGNLRIQQDAYGRFGLFELTADGQLVPRYFVVKPDGNWYIATGSEAVTYYKKQAVSAGGGIEALRTRLYKSNFISETEYKRKDEDALNNGILDAARSHSNEQVQTYTLDPGKPSYTFKQFNSWLSSKPSVSSGSESPDTMVQKTDRINTDQDINNFVMDMIGRNATDEEKQKYFDLVTKEQSKAKKTTKVSGDIGTATGEYLDEDDYFRIAAQVISPAIKGTKLEDIGKLGGKVAKQVFDIKEYAADYGVRIDTKQALDYTLQGLKPGGSLSSGALDTQKNSIREMSKAFYSNLTPLIDSGVRVRDIASQFAAYKGKILELPDNAVDVFDEDIQKALRNDGKPGVMSLTDYQIALRKDPRWSKTSNAREEASSYANSILKSFGVI